MFRRLVRFALPHMRFLFVRPGVCPCRHFAASTSGFLQIPPHDGHPCLRLTVPTAKSVVDFHHQVIAHAGRTKKGALFVFIFQKGHLAFSESVLVQIPTVPEKTVSRPFVFRLKLRSEKPPMRKAFIKNEARFSIKMFEKQASFNLFIYTDAGQYSLNIYVVKTDLLSVFKTNHKLDLPFTVFSCPKDCDRSI